MTIMAAEASTFHRRRLRERPGDYDPATRRSLEMGEFIPATHYLLAQRARALLRNRMANLFAAHRLDALLSPTMPVTTVPLPELFAQRPDYPAESPILSMIHHTFSANLTGQPALSVPCGLGGQRPSDRVPAPRTAVRRGDAFPAGPGLRAGACLGDAATPEVHA